MNEELVGRTSSALTWGATRFAVTAACVLLVLAAIICFVAWRRSGYRLGHGLLEGLRFLILALVAVTLLQPEWKTLFEPNEKPTLAVLWDDSASMTTADVPDETQAGAPLVARADTINAFQDVEAIQALAGTDLNVVVTPFSSKLEAAESATDLNGALLDLLDEHANLRAAVLVSDGDWNFGEAPSRAATRLRMADSPVFAVPVGSESRLPDLDLSTFEPPTFGIVNKPLRVPFAIESSLPRDHTVEVTLTISPSEIEDNRVKLEPDEDNNAKEEDRDDKEEQAPADTSDEEEQDEAEDKPATSDEKELLVSGARVIRKSITIPAMGRYEDAFSWLPQREDFNRAIVDPGAGKEPEGRFDLALEIPADEKESNTSNNRRVQPVAIRTEQLKVLVIECFPRWEYRYLRNALERDPGVEVSCLLFHPDISALGGGRGYLEAFPSKEDLSEYSVVFLGDVGVAPDQLTTDQCNQLAGLVRNQASGLVFLPGFRGHQNTINETELGDLVPVQIDPAQPRGWGSPSPGSFELTELGRRSLLTKLEDGDDANAKVWMNLPGFQWFAAATRAKAGSEVLAVHSSDSSRFGRVPLIVTRTAGSGKILFMGTDGAWRWREGVEDKYHYRFWGQVARWMAYQRSMAAGERMRVWYTPERPQSNDLVTLNANVMGTGGEPLADATVILSIAAPSGKTETVRLRSAGADNWGLFTGSFTPTEGGNYRLEASCAENGSTLPIDLNVQGEVREKIGRAARPDVLEEIARLSRGKLIDDGSFEKAFAAVAALPEPDPVEITLDLWAHWAWATLLLLLLVIFWIGRKMIGVV